MALPRMRPSFILEVPCRFRDAMEILRDRLGDNPQGVEGSFSSKHGVLCMPETDRRFWSPCLDLTLDEVTDRVGSSAPSRPETVKVWGTFSPRPEIWTGFVFAIGTLVIVSLASLFFGVAQLMLAHPPWALVVPVVATLLGGAIYTSALVGQGLSADDMYQMRAYVEACLQEAQEIASRRPALPPDASSQL